jgi:hypothetical protein
MSESNKSDNEKNLRCKIMEIANKTKFLPTALREIIKNSIDI